MADPGSFLRTLRRSPDASVSKMNIWSFPRASSLDRVVSLRGEYLEPCPEAQELYLELKIHAACVHLVQSAGQVAGYLPVESSSCLKQDLR